MAAGFEIYEDEGGAYRFRLTAANGEIVAQGESYPTPEDARSGVAAVKRAATDAEVPEQGLVSMRHRST